MDRSIRKAVLRRDRYTCQACGRQPAGQVHHLMPRSRGGSDSLDNLATLCGRCHMLISPIPDFVLWRAFRIPKNRIEAEREKVLQALAQFQAMDELDA